MFDRDKYVVVTHPGKAHRDDFLSVCLLLSYLGDRVTKVLRRDAAQADLDDPGTVVVDQGGEHAPDACNLDHHQLPRDAAPTCSVTLVLQALGVDLPFARQVLPWLEATELLDSKGPFATAQKLGCSAEALLALGSPIEGALLREFSGRARLQPDEPLWLLMRLVGDQTRHALEEMQERLSRLRSSSFVTDIDGLRVLFVTIPAAEHPTFGVEVYLRATGNDDVAVVVSYDDRGSGLSLFRRNDDRRVDFSRLEGRGDIEFAHKGGFIAKTKAASSDWAELVRLARTENQ